MKRILIILASLLGLRALLHYFNQNLKRIQKMKKIPPRLPSPPKEKEIPPEKIDNLKLIAWKKYKETEIIRFRNSKRNKMFYEDGGILYWLQKIIGYIKYELPNIADVEKIKLKYGEFLVAKLDNAIDKKIDEKGPVIEMQEQTFYRNLLTASNEENFRVLTKYIKERESEIKDLKENRNAIFYGNLWKKTCQPLENFISFNQEALAEASNVQKLKEDIQTQLNSLLEAFQDDIAFIYKEKISESEADELFLSAKNENCPAIIRKFDNNLYFNGLFSRTAMERDIALFY
jgi:hypothetical protein